jgi:hypothetical protein
LFSVPYRLVAVHTWLLIVEPDPSHVVYQQSIGKCPYLGNTPVSLFTYVHGDIVTKNILYIPQGCSLGCGLVFIFWEWMGRIILSPTPYVRTHLTCRVASVLPTAGEACFKMYHKGFCFYVHIADRVRVADHQLAPSGVKDHLRNPPRFPASLPAAPL